MDHFKSDAFAARVEELMNKHHIPGLAMAVTDGEAFASEGFGKATIEPSRACTADTLFDVASVSKSLTAACIARLVEDDNYPDVKWDAIVSKLLPDDFILPGEGYTEGVTVDDLIGHRTGMPDHEDAFFGPQASTPDTPLSVVRNLRNLPVAAPLRSKFIYCNQMYTAATLLIERQTGQTFADYLQENFLDPLKMTSTYLQPSAAVAAGQSERLVQGHGWDESAGRVFAFDLPDAPEAQGAGSITTSANDYIRWVCAMLRPGEACIEGAVEGPASVVTPTMRRELLRARTITDPNYEKTDPKEPLTAPALYAAGWEVSYYRGARLAEHTGGVPGIGTTHFFLPERGFGAVIFGNSGYSGDVPTVLARELIDAALDVPQSERPDWSRILDGDPEKADVERVAEQREEREEEVRKLREELCPGIGVDEKRPQILALEAYTGEYHNEGYRNFTVQTRKTGGEDQEQDEEVLFVDAPDRSFGFTLTFEHVADQTKYIARHVANLERDEKSIKAEFILDDQGGKARRMGLCLEEEIDEYIWFDRVD